MRKRSGRRSVTPVATAVATLGALVLLPSPAHAADVDVPCDPAALVDAVASASASPAADTLALAPNCVYTLTKPAVDLGQEGLPSIRGKLTIHGNNATIRRAPDAPQFRLISNWGDLTFDRLTLTGGHAPDGVGTDSSGQGRSGESGGAISNWGPLTITDSVLTGNSAGAGAAGAAATATTPAGRGGLGGFGGAISSYISSGAGAITITNSLIADNRTGAGGRGGDGTGSAAGGHGGSGGFGGGVESLRGAVVRITGSTITRNATASGSAGGSGGSEGGSSGDGGGGGVGAGLFLSTQEGQPLNPVVSTSFVTHNRAGHGGDAGVPGPGGYAGWAGSGGNGGGIAVFYDTLTLDGSRVTGNTAGMSGAGSFPYGGSGGGLYTVRAHIALANGSSAATNRPDNCYPVETVPGCVNVRTAPRARSAGFTGGATVLDLGIEDRAAAVRAALAERPMS